MVRAGASPLVGCQARGFIAWAVLDLLVSRSAAAQVRFTDLAAGAGIDAGTLSQGCAWADYDSDGYPDILVTSNRLLIVGSPSKLYHNQGTGSFVDQAGTLGVDDPGPAFGAAWADFDNDGDPDPYLVRGAIPFVTGEHRLFRNEGAASPWPSYRPPVAAETGRSVAWADFDNDGFVDAFVTDGPAIPLLSNPTPTLLRNRGDGTFQDVTVAAGIGDTVAGMGVAWGDYDDDGWPDLFLASYGIPDSPIPFYSTNVLYRNRRDGTFEDVSASAGVRGDEDGLKRGCFGAAWGDYDRDGRLDLYVACGFDNLAVVTTGFGTTNLLYRNEGGGQFREVGVATLTADPEGSFGCAWGDYDLDGHLDLYVANGLAVPPAAPTNRLFRYSPLLGIFIPSEGVAGVDSSSFSQGCAWADYDRDGWLDLYVVETDAQNKLYHNDGGNGNHWIELRLKGVRSNRSGIGARVTATAAGGTQTRVVGSGSGYQSADDSVVHFGLGSASSADILVRWPGPDFCIQSLGTVLADQVVDVVELCAPPAGDVLRGPYRQPLSGVFPLPAYLPMPATPPFVDPEPVLGGPEPLLFYGLPGAGFTLRMVSTTDSVELSW